MKRLIVGFALFVLNVAVWYAAGYLAGEARGRGWRGAVIEQRCVVVCPDAKGVEL